MSGNVTGNAKVQLPISKAVGAQHQPPGSNGVAPPQVAVPSALAMLAINGKILTIDVRSMSATDVVKLINTVPGVVAAIDGVGRLTLTGVSSIDGDGSLRAILGI